MKHSGLKAAINVVERVVGRPRLAKFARLLTNEVRLDSQNDISINGETLVQVAARTIDQPVVLDVGGHFGEWSLSLLAQAGSSPTLHVFEPSATAATVARENLGQRAKVHDFGMSDRPGQSVLHIVHQGAGSNSVVPFRSAERSSTGTETILLSTVDEFCSDTGIREVALLKIDAEGHDLAVVRGAREMLARHAIELVQFEYNWRWVESRSFLFDAFEYLEDLGYRVGKVCPRGIEVYPRWHPELESFREANYLAFRPVWLDRLPTIEWWGG